MKGDTESRLFNYYKTCTIDAIAEYEKTIP